MRQSAGELAVLRAKGAHGQADRAGKSLFALADVTARGADFATALKRVEPIGAKSARVSFAAKPRELDALIGWVDNLGRSYNVPGDGLFR